MTRNTLWRKLCKVICIKSEHWSKIDAAEEIAIHYTQEFSLDLLEWVRENYYDTGSCWTDSKENYTSEELIEKYIQTHGTK